MDHLRRLRVIQPVRFSEYQRAPFSSIMNTPHSARDQLPPRAPTMIARGPPTRSPFRTIIMTISQRPRWRRSSHSIGRRLCGMDAAGSSSHPIAGGCQRTRVESVRSRSRSSEAAPAPLGGERQLASPIAGRKRQHDYGRRCDAVRTLHVPSVRAAPLLENRYTMPDVKGRCPWALGFVTVSNAVVRGSP